VELSRLEECVLLFILGLKPQNMKNKHANTQKKKFKKIALDENWEKINPNACGIDIGARELFVCVPSDRAKESVRRFGTKTPDLEQLAKWLKDCRIETVAMEATGIYWIATFQLLERKGFKVVLVNPRQIKNVTGKKSDVMDCQWIHKLHTFGLLGASFRPADPYCVARTYMRLRDDLIAGSTAQIQLMQKALHQMNIQLSHVLSDITGSSGMAIIGAIIAGQRDPIALAELASRRVKSTKDEMAKALIGDWRPEHLYCLAQAQQMYLRYQLDIAQCDAKLAEELEKLPNKVDPHSKPMPPKIDGKKQINEKLRLGLYCKFGVDVTAIEGIGPTAALTMLTEVGADLSAFPSEKHFCSWLGVCPDNRISGGKVLSSRTRRVVNRMADVLRMSATTLKSSQTALGAFYRRMVARLGPAEGITAVAHKLARLLYSLIKYGHEYIRTGMEEYEKKNADRKMKALRRMAESLGVQLLEPQLVTAGVS
jgi:transposase